jgi:predicted ATPase
MRPPIVTSIRVRNFRALHDLEVRGLSPLTVLIGPNGSGKSTFFDLFAFLSECFTENIRSACDRRGGLREIRSRGGEGPIQVELSYREAPKSRLLTYHLELDEDGATKRPVVAREWLRWATAPAQGEPRHILDFQRGSGYVYNEPIGQREPQTLSGADVLAVNALGQFKDHPRVEALRAFISGWYLSYFSTDAARGMPIVGPQERLSRSGDNLNNVLQYLGEQHSDRLRHILRALSESVPGLAAVALETTSDGRLVLWFREAAFEQPILARFASDGTLKMLAYLTLLFDPSPAPLIGVEEPENHLYPTLMPGLAEVCRTASAGSQILVTTHSHEFLNACDPGEVLVLYRDEAGYTRAVRPEALPVVRDMVASGAELGWLWEKGYFKPAPAPTTLSGSFPAAS